MSGRYPDPEPALRLYSLRRHRAVGVSGEVLAHPDTGGARRRPVPAGRRAAAAPAPAGRINPVRVTELLGAFDIGPTRTLQQDVEFGVIQIVDIALRAISPAVNDPSTAISCIDQLSRILIRWLGRSPPESVLFDPPHVPRVFVPWIDIDGMLDTAFEQIRHYAATDAAVSLRLLRAIGDIAGTVQHGHIRANLLERAQRVVDGCGARLGEPVFQPAEATSRCDGAAIGELSGCADARPCRVYAATVPCIRRGYADGDRSAMEFICGAAIFYRRLHPSGHVVCPALLRGATRERSPVRLGCRGVGRRRSAHGR